MGCGTRVSRRSRPLPNAGRADSHSRTTRSAGCPWTVNAFARRTPPWSGARCGASPVPSRDRRSGMRSGRARWCARCPLSRPPRRRTHPLTRPMRPRHPPVLRRRPPPHLDPVRFRPEHAGCRSACSRADREPDRRHASRPRSRKGCTHRGRRPITRPDVIGVDGPDVTRGSGTSATRSMVPKPNARDAPAPGRVWHRSRIRALTTPRPHLRT